MEAAPAVAPAVAETADAPAMGDELAPAGPAVAPDAVRSTGDTSGPPADGADGTDGATGAPDAGAAGIDGMAGGAVTGGRRSDP